MIKPLLLSQLSHRFGGELINGDVEFSCIATDTRKSIDGALFIAIKGNSFDAHDYLDQAIDQGAIALVIHKSDQHKINHLTIPVWLVEDSVLALGNIARLQRENYDGVVFAITGSNGKTSVKGMLESILCAAFGKEMVFATQGNLNNHLGVPFSLLAINKYCRYAVIEMGASAVGEIDYLSEIAQPHCSVVNNVSPAHIEGFGSVENIAIAKSEIYDHLVDDGVAVINRDDCYSSQWFEKNSQRSVLSFSSEDKTADVYISQPIMNDQHCYGFTLSFGQEKQFIQLSVLGLHSVMNAAAAASLALSCDVDLFTIKKGLELFSGVPGRIQVSVDAYGNTLIDDTYNASPKSMCAAIDILAEFSEQTVLVIGDMGELGDEAKEQHQKIGQYAKEKNITRLFALGELSKEAVKTFGANAIAAVDFDDLITRITPCLKEPSHILVKGSRSARMERVVYSLKHFGESDASLVS